MRLARTIFKFNIAYYAAIIPDYNLLTKNPSAAVVKIAHKSINTARPLNMNTRSVRTPDFEAIAVSYSMLPVQSIC
jgi:hypothetical protein